MEALAIAPGIPSIEDQEKRDRVATGTYQKASCQWTFEDCPWAPGATAGAAMGIHPASMGNTREYRL